MAPDPRAVLGDAVVVGEDRAGPDVGALTDLGVADVAEVGHLGALADLRVLGLHEGADLAAGPEPGAGPQVGERADDGALPDHGQLTVGARHPGPGADLAVLERAVGTDHGVLADHGGAEQLDAGQQRHVGLEDDVGIDPRGGGVHHADPLEHPAVDDAPVHEPAQLGQLLAVVGTLGLRDVLDREGAHGQAGVTRELDRVGEVVLALGVVVADLAQRLGQELGVEGQDPGVDLPDLALVDARVLLLDDRHDVAVGVADDPAVAVRVGDDPAEDAHGTLCRLVLGGEGAQRVALEQRGVAVRDQDRALERLPGGQDGLDGDPHRVTRAVLLLLHREQRRRRQLLDVGADLVAPVTDDGDDPLGLDRGHRGQHVADHAAPADGVEDLHPLRLHPGAAARGEDDDGHVAGHEVDPPGSTTGSL